MAKGFYLIILLCYIFGDCVSEKDNGIIKFYTVPPVVKDYLEHFSVHCKVNSSIPLASVHINHNGTKMSSDPNTETNELEASNLPTSEDYSGDYTCTVDPDRGSSSLNVIIHPTCIELGSLNGTIADDFSSKLDKLEHADLENCLNKALHEIVDLTRQLHSVNNTPSTVPPPPEETQTIQAMSATVIMTVSGSEIHARDDLHVSCTMDNTVVQKGVRFSWRWTEWKYINSTEDPNVNEFDWSVLLRNDPNGTDIASWPEQYVDSNSTCEGSNLTISAALVEKSGRFFCVAEFPHDVGRLSHAVRYSDIRVVNPIEPLHLIRNGKDSNQTVPIVIPHSSPLEVNCTATGKWAPPDTVNITAHIGNKSVISGNEPLIDPVNKTTARLTIPWEMIEGKDVKVLCEAIGDHKSIRSINATVEVSNPISLCLIWNGTCLKLDETTPIVIPLDTPLEVSCNATGLYATPEAVSMSAQIDGKPVEPSLKKSNISGTTTTTAKLTIPWKTIEGKNVTVSCQAKGERNSNPNITSSTLKVSSATPSTHNSKEGNTVPADTNTNDATSSPSESSGFFGTPTVFGGIATVLVVVVVIGVVLVAYRSRDKLRSWIMEKDVSKAALRKAKYARAKGGRGWIKYAKLPRDISEAMSHNE